MTRWFVAHFDGAFQHLVCEELFDALADDMTARGAPLEDKKPAVKNRIDQPGPCYLTRPWEPFQMDDIIVEIPSEDVAAFISALEELPERIFADGSKYFKLHGFCFCIVFTETQKKQFSQLLKAGLLKAEERATVFYADKKPHSQVLREAAAKANKIPIEEVGDLGGHKIDRFKIKSSGDKN